MMLFDDLQQWLWKPFELFATPDWDEMEQTDDHCPSCGNDLLVERSGRIWTADVYWCRRCGFSGPKEPAYVIYEELRSAIGNKKTAKDGDTQ